MITILIRQEYGHTLSGSCTWGLNRPVRGILVEADGKQAEDLVDVQIVRSARSRPHVQRFVILKESYRAKVQGLGWLYKLAAFTFPSVAIGPFFSGVYVTPWLVPLVNSCRRRSRLR